MKDPMNSSGQHAAQDCGGTSRDRSATQLARRLAGHLSGRHTLLHTHALELVSLSCAGQPYQSLKTPLSPVIVTGGVKAACTFYQRVNADSTLLAELALALNRINQPSPAEDLLSGRLRWRGTAEEAEQLARALDQADFGNERSPWRILKTCVRLSTSKRADESCRQGAARLDARQWQAQTPWGAQLGLGHLPLAERLAMTRLWQLAALPEWPAGYNRVPAADCAAWGAHQARRLEQALEELNIDPSDGLRRNRPLNLRGKPILTLHDKDLARLLDLHLIGDQASTDQASTDQASTDQATLLKLSQLLFVMRSNPEAWADARWHWRASGSTPITSTLEEPWTWNLVDRHELRVIPDDQPGPDMQAQRAAKRAMTWQDAGTPASQRAEKSKQKSASQKSASQKSGHKRADTPGPQRSKQALTLQIPKGARIGTGHNGRLAIRLLRLFRPDARGVIQASRGPTDREAHQMMSHPMLGGLIGRGYVCVVGPKFTGRLQLTAKGRKVLEACKITVK